MFRRRVSLRQQQQQQGSQSKSRTQRPPAVPSDFLAVSTNQVAAAHVQSSPFCFISTASQIGATAWFVSVLLWTLLGIFAVW